MQLNLPSLSPCLDCVPATTEDHVCLHPCLPRDELRVWHKVAAHETVCDAAAADGGDDDDEDEEEMMVGDTATGVEGAPAGPSASSAPPYQQAAEAPYFP